MLKKKTISAKMCFGKEFDYLDIVQKDLLSQVP